MTPDILKEAIQYADGFGASDDKAPLFYMDDGYGEVISFMSWSYPRWLLAVLASQLISQIDAMDGFAFDSDPYGCAKTWEDYGDGRLGRISKANGPNRDENSITACVEFYRANNEKGQTDETNKTG